MRLIELVFVKELAAPPEAVWPWISDPAHLSAWSDVTVTALEPGPEGGWCEPGAKREVKLPISIVTLRLQEELVEVSEPHRFVYSVFRGAPVRSHRGTIELAATETGTRLEWVVEIEPLLPGLGWIARRSLNAQFAKGLVRMEELILAQQNPPSQ